MRFHAQNLNEKPGGRTGSIFRHGRCWLYFGRNDVGRCPELRLEWSLFTPFWHVGIEFGEAYENTVQVSLACGLFSVWLTLEGFRGDWLPRDRESGIAFHNQSLWIKPWSRRWEHRSADPWWVRGVSISFVDLLLGRWKYSERSLSKHDALIPMGEGAYPATVEIKERTWKRPRWFARRMIGASIDIPGGIPFMGKGENSWDCGEDGLYGMSCDAKTVEEAIGQVVASVLRSRRRHGKPSDLVPFISPRVKPSQDGGPKEAA